MATLTMPSAPPIQAVRFGLVGNDQVFRSPLSKSIQTLELTGSMWIASFTVPVMARAQAAAWVAFLTRLNGRAGRFFAGDPSGKTPRGVATGTPLINGAAQTGTSLITDGWTVSITNILREGDYIAYDVPSGNRQLHMVVIDVNSDSGGNATLTISPPIRESPADGATIITASTTCIMLLAASDGAAWDVNQALHYGIRFSGEEAFKL